MPFNTALTTAWIVLDKEFIQRHPSSADTDHHSRAQDANQTKFLAITELRRKI